MLQVRRLRWGTKAPVNLAANTTASSANRRCATSGAFGRRRCPAAMESSTSSVCQGYSAEIQGAIRLWSLARKVQISQQAPFVH